MQGEASWLKLQAGASRERALRDWNKILGLWRACDNTACRRANACRGNVRACAPGNFARAPEGVQAWFAALAVAKNEGLSFDQAMARLDGTAAEAAFHAWHDGRLQPQGESGANR